MWYVQITGRLSSLGTVLADPLAPRYVSRPDLSKYDFRPPTSTARQSQGGHRCPDVEHEWCRHDKVTGGG